MHNFIHSAAQLSATQLPSSPASHTRERNRLLASLTPEDYALVARNLEPVLVSASQIVAIPGDIDRYVLFPRDAVLSWLVPMENGKAVCGALLGNESMVGVWAFLGGEAAVGEVAALIPGEAARMRISEFRALLTRSLRMQSILQRYTLALMNEMARTAACNQLHNVSQRCARWLMMSRDCVGGDTFPMTHELLASVLGVRRASVTQSAEALQDAGILDYRRGSMTVVDPHRLGRAACEDYLLCRSGYDRLVGT
jgi:CRP-like cAMP-binding protein